MRLPSMHALMVFEAAGRHESFLNAAAELNVTPSAVSHQISSLEATLGLPLFTRENRKVTLTGRGKLYWSSIHKLFSQIRDETEILMSRNSGRALTVRCSMVFMRYWLMPRLVGLYQTFPEINIAFQIARSDQPSTLDEDCVIRAGDGQDQDMQTEYLFDAELVAVCSPSYAERHSPIARLGDLRQHTLLHSRTAGRWSKWLGDASDDVMSSAKHLSFEAEGLLYQAAIEGLGLALGRRRLLASELEMNRLVSPLETSSRHDEGYYLMYRFQQHFPPGLEEFRSWLLAETERTPERLALVGQSAL